MQREKSKPVAKARFVGIFHILPINGYGLTSRNRTCTSTGNLSKLAQFINNCARIRFKIIIKTYILYQTVHVFF
jgi:hypothetical protein